MLLQVDNLNDCLRCVTQVKPGLTYRADPKRGGEFFSKSVSYSLPLSCLFPALIPCPALPYPSVIPPQLRQDAL